MLNLYPFDNSIQAEPHEEASDEQLAEAIIDKLNGWEQKILLSLIDIGFIENWPTTPNSAIDAVDAVECFSANLKNYTITPSTEVHNA